MYKRNKTLESEVNKIWSQKNADMGGKGLENIQIQIKHIFLGWPAEKVIGWEQPEKFNINQVEAVFKVF